MKGIGRLFRIHLSTAMILVFVSAILLFLNLRSLSIDSNKHQRYVTNGNGPRYYEYFEYYGWPWSYYNMIKYNLPSEREQKIADVFSTPSVRREIFLTLIADGLVALVILVSVGAALEFKIEKTGTGVNSE